MRINSCWLIFSYLAAVCWFWFLNTNAADTLAFGQVMKDWEFLESSNKVFRLLFFTPGEESTRYLGIRYSQILSGDVHTKMVWVANRARPLRGTLSVSQDGNLVLTDDYDGTVITINDEQPIASTNVNTSATLLGTGNLVLKTGERVVWQSFDYPSDTWLPGGMKLGVFNSISGQQRHQNRLTSWLSPQVPSLGAFTLGIDTNNTKQLVIWRRGVIYWRSGIWNGYNFTYYPQGNEMSEFNFSYFSSNNESYFTFTRTNTDPWSSWIDLESSGEIDLYSFGPNYVFDSTNYCEESQVEYRSKGCEVPNPSNCTTGDAFIETSGSMNIWTDLNNVSLGLSDCKVMCTTDCSCTAYASVQIDGTGCRFSDGTKNGSSLANIFYLRNNTVVEKERPKIVPSYPRAYPIPNRPNNSRKLWFGIGVPLAFIIVSSLCYMCWRNHCFGENNGRRKHGTREGTQSALQALKTEAAIIDKMGNGIRDYELSLFTLASIEIATDYFSDANKIGQGGFGPVYKGKFVNGQEIAVKRLSRSSGQGLEEFKNEVILISRLQHRNLVRLLGCCTEGDERILIYEFLSNKSLDTFLFDITRRTLLDWKIRRYIIEGIAQGLQYLHKYSRLRIIHRDLKTSNILLDSDMNPKISDFGTARIFGDHECQANTRRIVGTYGYMSPEYALDGLFSVKSDIFSFGVMMLEIISGKKNTGFYQPDRALNLLGYAWDLWKEGRGIEIMDHALVETCSSTSEIMRYIQVGFLCVQESAADRPTISEVVSMLNNEIITILTPKRPAFSAIVGVNDTNTPEIEKSCSINNVTISVGGR